MLPSRTACQDRDEGLLVLLKLSLQLFQQELLLLLVRLDAHFIKELCKRGLKGVISCKDCLQSLLKFDMIDATIEGIRKSILVETKTSITLDYDTEKEE